MKKRALTLLEIMIAIFLITLITGAIGYNMKGAMDKGRVFRTEQAKEQLEDLLRLALDEQGDADKIAKNPAQALKDTGLAKNPDKLILDGWNQKFDIRATPDKSGFTVQSLALEKYKAKHPK